MLVMYVEITSLKQFGTFANSMNRVLVTAELILVKKVEDLFSNPTFISQNYFHLIPSSFSWELIQLLFGLYLHNAVFNTPLPRYQRHQ